ncbi:MAG: FtsX-like permease family protein [Synergistaceae bacterium]|nr:FtsX-like permease family protein [Synergistaceae bacterium]
MVKSPLLNKLFRTIGSTRGPFFGVVAVVAVGLSVFVSMAAVSDNLMRSRENFYRQTDFADLFFHVVRAPEGVVEKVSAVNGVSRASGRIQKDVSLFRQDGTRATLRLTGFKLPMENELNRILVQQGRLFEKNPEGGALEILLSSQFAKANEFRPGSTVSVAAEGKEKPMEVVGIAASPEFVYAIKNAASVFEDPSGFGAAMISLKQAQQVLDFEGSVNQILVRLVPGSDPDRVRKEIRTILEPYGNLTDYPQRDQVSEAILRGELEQLRVAATFLPAFFLGLAALMQTVFLSRLVKAARTQIGLMKALGYDNGRLMLLYGGYSLASSGMGGVAGILAGYGLARVFTRLYATYFNLPRLDAAFNPRSAGLGLALSLTLGCLAGFAGARSILGVRPAEAMRLPPPRGAVKLFLENWHFLWGRLDLASKMSLRSIFRNRFRSAVTFLGVLVSIGMLVVSLFTRDSVESLFDRHFNRELRYDLLARFPSPVRNAELLNLERLPGVIRVEPLFELPVRLMLRGRREETVVVGIDPGQSLLGMSDEGNRPRGLPVSGLLLDWNSARKLGARPGDFLEVETLLGKGPSRKGTVAVAGLSRKSVGGVSYLDLETLNSILQEKGLVTGAAIKTERGRSQEAERAMAGMINVSSVLSRQKEREYLEKNLAYMNLSIAILVAFSSLLGLAIIFNASALAFSERRRDLASLRAMGFSSEEVALFLLKENLFLLVAGTLAGLPFGKLLSEAYARAVSTDLFSFVAVVFPRTYILSAAGGVAFAALAFFLGIRSLERLDFAETVKARD